MDNISKTLEDFLKKSTVIKKISDDGMEETICDLETGECHILRLMDGLIERVNKKYITEDGRLLLQD